MISTAWPVRYNEKIDKLLLNFERKDLKMNCVKLMSLICVLAFVVLFNQSVYSQDNSEEFLKSIMQGEIKEVENYVDMGADVNAQTNDGETALQRAEKIHKAKLADMTEIIEILKKSDVE